MDSANVNLVRSIFAASERGDFSSTEWADPQIVFVRTGGGPFDGTWFGPAGMAEGWREWLREWEGFRAEAREYRELDDERVLVLTRLSGRGRISGLDLAEARAQGAALFHIHGGKVTRLVHYPDHERALADVGLKPGQPPS